MKRLHEAEAPTKVPTTPTDADKEKRAKKDDSGTSEEDVDSEDDEISSSDNEVFTSRYYVAILRQTKTKL